MRNKFFKELTFWGFWVVVFLSCAIAYVHPGASLLFSGETTRVMGDGTDSLTAPYQYWILDWTRQHHPERLLYGSVAVETYSAPNGTAIWNPWIERISVFLLTPFVALEQMSTAWVILFMALNGLTVVLLGRIQGWPTPLSVGLGLCWAFSAYVRARAKVHITFVGLYHLPLIFLALAILQKKHDRRSIFFASFALLAAATTSHYYLIYSIFFAPFFLLYFFSAAEVRLNWKPRLRALILASLPAIILLAQGALFRIPAEFKGKIARELPVTGESATWPHPYTEIFSARPLDYLGGDVAIGLGDWNFLRKSVTDAIHQDIGQGNHHERANGIRWIILGFLAAVCILLVRRRLEAALKWPVLALLCFAVFAFWASLSPSYFGFLGPSGWLHALVAQMRVPSRAGVFVHFAILLLVGHVLAHWIQTAKYKILCKPKFLWLLPLAAFLDFPPFLNAMPIAPVLPRYQILQNSDPRDCGLGMRFPYVSGAIGLLDFYYFLQRMRGSACVFVNTDAPDARDAAFFQKLGPHEANVKRMMASEEGMKEDLIRVANCLSLRWIIFDSRLPGHWRAEVCARWGGGLSESEVCMRPAQPPFTGDPGSCVRN